MVRGEVFRLARSRAVRGAEERSGRHAVLVQADELMGLGTVLVAPSSTRARPATFRPTIEIAGVETRIFVKQTTVVDPERLGPSAGRLDRAEMQAVDEALTLILGL